MKLIVTEKPSVGRSIAAALGIKEKKDGYMEGLNAIVTWCIGHLVDLAPAELYDTRYAKWRMEDLPIIPETWKYIINDSTKAQFETVKALMNRSDVDTVVCATDAGREGELVFRLVYNQAGCNKPIQRLWIASMEESAIQEGFRSLRNGTDYNSLYQAALCRDQADWLVGINASRLYSLLYDTTLNVGRVMSPTLALIVKREAVIANFQAETFYTVQLRCGFIANSERMSSKEEAERIAAACNLNTATVKTIDKKHRTEKPPRLYDLTTLQRDANRVFGYSAQQTLDYAQSLYEKQIITYREAGYSKKFAAAHADDLSLHKAAKAYFDTLGTKKLPSIKSLSAEYDELIKKNKRLYGAYHKARDLMQQSLTAKANLDLLLHLDEQKKERSYAHENDR